MHLVLIAILFWPGVLATASGVLRGVRVGAPARSPGDVWWKRLLSRRVGRASEAFLVAWLVPAWVFFELFGAKLAHYTMPLYPAVALLTARGLAAYIRARRGRHMDLGERLWLTLGLCITGGVLVLSVLGANARHWAWGPTAGLVGACAGALFMLVAWRAVRRRQLGSAQAWGVIAGGCALGAFFGGPAPKVLPGSETGAIMARVVQAKDWETRPIASEHAEDSMVFFTRGRVERLPPGGGAAWLDAHQNGIVVMRFDPTRDWPTRGHHAVATVPWVGEMGLVRREWWIVEAEGPWIP
jgi:4-amino-4-deoxy-L-arabinose transferase-like glycosyltransferase